MSARPPVCPAVCHDLQFDEQLRPMETNDKQSMAFNSFKTTSKAFPADGLRL